MLNPFIPFIRVSGEVVQVLVPGFVYRGGNVSYRPIDVFVVVANA